jgi:hypothetical protein
MRLSLGGSVAGAPRALKRYLQLGLYGVVGSSYADGEPARHEAACQVHGVAVAVYEGSRLYDAEDERLALVRGRALACAHPYAQAVHAALSDPLARFPRERLLGPLRVHLDPRLPSAQAPLAGIEVHVTSRELLVTGAALGALGADAWRHELFHGLAAAPPAGSSSARRLWLTLEEGLVSHLAPNAADPAPAPPGVDAHREPGEAAFELLAVPAYDPHQLAEGFTQELERASPQLAVEDAVACLAAVPQPAPHAVETLRSVVRRFAERCPANAARVLSRALAHWLPAALSPWAAPGSALEPRASGVSGAHTAARHAETR